MAGADAGLAAAASTSPSTSNPSRRRSPRPAAHASGPGSSPPGALDADKGRLDDPVIDAAADDAADLADRLARGSHALFRGRAST